MQHSPQQLWQGTHEAGVAGGGRRAGCSCMLGDVSETSNDTSWQPTATTAAATAATDEHAVGNRELEGLVGDWLTLPEVAELLRQPVTKVRQLLGEHKLAAVRRGEHDALYVPARFLTEGAILKGLPGTLMVLRDGRFSDEEAIRWLYTPDPSLPGSPVQALVENRGTEVKRRAQALGF